MSARLRATTPCMGKLSLAPNKGFTCGTNRGWTRERAKWSQRCSSRSDRRPCCRSAIGLATFEAWCGERVDEIGFRAAVDCWDDI
jgi:hypothetical protein